MRFMGCERCILTKTEPVKLAIFKGDLDLFNILWGGKLYSAGRKIQNREP